MTRLKFSSFADLFERILKPEKSIEFFEIRQQKGLWIAWRKKTRVFCQIAKELHLWFCFGTFWREDKISLQKGAQAYVEECRERGKC